MKSINLIIICIAIVCGTVFAQPDLSKDRDYQNFKRNYDKAVKHYQNYKSDNSAKNEMSLKRYAKYSRKFLDKLISKYGETRFKTEKIKLSEIESIIQSKNKKKKSQRADFEYVMLWSYRLKPTMLNSFNATANLQEFDKAKLSKAYQNAKNDSELKRRLTSEDIINFEMALNDFESLLQKAKVFDTTTGMIGKPIEDSKRIQDKNYFVTTLNVAKKINDALLIVSPNSPSLLAKQKQINSLVANAAEEVKRNTPKMVKKYKDNLPKAVTRNKLLENQFVDAIRFQKYPDTTIIDGIITSSNWVLQKSVDGRSLYRYREGVVTAKTKEGDCWFQYYNFRQPYTGSGFGKVIRGSTGERFYIQCSKIK